jgi:hypothetical protein
MINEFQQEILSRILSEVFSADMQDFNREIEAVVGKNRELLGPTTAAYGFYFGKNWYSVPWCRGRSAQSLHPDLYLEMIRVESRKKSVEDDWKIIDQVLCRIISPFHTYQDIRDELPEVLVSLVPSLLGAYPRTREPASSIQSDPRAIRQYERVLNKIHSYVAMRYIL